MKKDVILDPALVKSETNRPLTLIQSVSPSSQQTRRQYNHITIETRHSTATV